MKTIILFSLFILICFYKVTANDSTNKSKNIRDTLKSNISKALMQSTGNSLHISLEKGDNKTLIDYSVAFLTPVVALLAVLIALRQSQTQRYQVKLDLFERRIEIIENVRHVLTEIDKHFSGDSEKIDLELFRVAYRHSRYLFSKDIQDYLKSIDSYIGSLEDIELKLKDQAISGEEKRDLEAQKEENIIWLRAQRVDHESKFTRFMTLNKI